MAWRQEEPPEEFEGRIILTTEKSRLVEDTFTNIKYFVPKKCTVDFNPSGEDTYIFVVTAWWWNKKDDFIAND